MEPNNGKERDERLAEFGEKATRIFWQKFARISDWNLAEAVEGVSILDEENFRRKILDIEPETAGKLNAFYAEVNEMLNGEFANMRRGEVRLGSWPTTVLQGVEVPEDWGTRYPKWFLGIEPITHRIVNGISGRLRADRSKFESLRDLTDDEFAARLSNWSTNILSATKLDEMFLINSFEEHLKLGVRETGDAFVYLRRMGHDSHPFQASEGEPAPVPAEEPVVADPEPAPEPPVEPVIPDLDAIREPEQSVAAPAAPEAAVQSSAEQPAVAHANSTPELPEEYRQRYPELYENDGGTPVAVRLTNYIHHDYLKPYAHDFSYLRAFPPETLNEKLTAWEEGLLKRPVINDYILRASLKTGLKLSEAEIDAVFERMRKHWETHEPPAARPPIRAVPTAVERTEAPAANTPPPASTTTRIGSPLLGSQEDNVSTSRRRIDVGSVGPRVRRGFAENRTFWVVLALVVALVIWAYTDNSPGLPGGLSPLLVTILFFAIVIGAIILLAFRGMLRIAMAVVLAVILLVLLFPGVWAPLPDVSEVRNRIAGWFGTEAPAAVTITAEDVERLRAEMKAKDEQLEAAQAELKRRDEAVKVASAPAAPIPQASTPPPPPVQAAATPVRRRPAAARPGIVFEKGSRGTPVIRNNRVTRLPNNETSRR